ncbi:MAG TPA: SRPBCC domain-containing protein [Saprospiraceae bacterium]|nr:SRPBCC domain-containing protein [Saprospiraceae bacterium]
MSANLLFDFNVKAEERKIEVRRVFAGGLDLVWKAWTSAELLDQWWAPKPYRTETKSLNFQENGIWHYSMLSPEGERHWCLAEYKAIKPSEQYVALDAFCNEQCEINTDFPRSLWTNKFTVDGDHTIVNISILYEKVEDVEKIIELGFREGFTMAMGNLDELLSNLTK